MGGADELEKVLMFGEKNGERVDQCKRMLEKIWRKKEKN